jgi:DNA-binding IclR family transcriptional regulator
MDLTSTPFEKPEVAGAQTLRRGLSVLRLLTRVGPGGLPMGEIGRRLELNKATAVRLTRTLVDEGFVVHDRPSRRYRLGPEAFAVGLAAEPSFELQRLAAPTLRALAAESGDTVFFTVLHGYESICLSRDEGDFPIRNQLIKPGDRWPLGVGAGSLAILAALSNDEIDNVLTLNAAARAERFPRCTDTAIRRLIRETRELGYCVQPGMIIEDSWAVGVVVRNAARNPVASISIAAIRSRLGPVRSTTLGNRLIRASEELTAMQTEAAIKAGS